jgi:hypothetical protein
MTGFIEEINQRRAATNKHEVCQATKKGGEPCQNAAVDLIGERWLCGVHAKPLREDLFKYRVYQRLAFEGAVMGWDEYQLRRRLDEIRREYLGVVDPMRQARLIAEAEAIEGELKRRERAA